MKFRLIICLFLAGTSLMAQDNWTTLFNGQNLDGWKVLGTDATFSVSGDTIIGTNRGRTNTFLATEKPYGDFILELDVWADPRMNSGIQFRSAQRPNGRVFGYQAEIDPSERAYSGGIYDEARRDWLYPLSLNPAGQKAFKLGEWNKYRIQAIGSSIVVWVNDICTAVLEDDLSLSGFIALQVHGVGTKAEEGRQAKWRNIRLWTSQLAKESRKAPQDVYQLNLLGNNLSDREKNLGWEMLWNGKNLKGWRQVHAKRAPAEGWKIENAELSVVPSGDGTSSDGKDLITKKSYSNFELSWQYKLTEGANSGIKYLVNEDLNPNGGAIGLEFQLLDNQKHPDAKKGRNGNRTQASLYDLIPAENLSWADMGKRFLRGIGQWNHARIIVKGNKVEHWLNGFKVVEYERNTDLFNEMVSKSKYKDWPNFGNEKSGHIVLQDHGNAVSFRSIKIREF
ncbi:MAG: DUF1080 domain-containing protein [Roseivirga sp.]|nr:DUF1080 domain-containing protein [Roseivirga sp.]